MTAREAVRGVLSLIVRGPRERGGPWGEAVLAEFDEVRGGLPMLRWAAGGARVALRERWTSAPRRARRLVVAGLLLVVGGLVANQFLATVRYVPSASMEPTIRPGERVLVDRAVFRATGLSYGDLVLVDIPGTDTPTIRRVVGLPGDVVECSGGDVLRNGRALDEPYVAGGTDCTTATVPEGGLYLLGDHREVAVDSRQFGAVPASDVRGRAWVRVWPVTLYGV